MLRQRAPAPVRAARDDAPRAVSLLVGDGDARRLPPGEGGGDASATCAAGTTWCFRTWRPRTRKRSRGRRPGSIPAPWRAELAWWVARRVPGQNSAEQIGGLIADECALLLSDARARRSGGAVARAGGRAARLPRSGRPDWDGIGRLLLSLTANCARRCRLKRFDDRRSGFGFGVKRSCGGRRRAYCAAVRQTCVFTRPAGGTGGGSRA